MQQPEDPVEWVRRLAESYRQVRLGPGVTGKTAAGMVALLFIWGIVATRLTHDLVQDAALILAGGIPTCVYVWWTKRTHELAARNPGVALLEGAELLEFQRFAAHAKGRLESGEQPSVHEAGGSQPANSDDNRIP